MTVEEFIPQLSHHIEDQYTTFIFSTRGGVPVCDITHIDDGSYGVSIFNPINMRDPIRWWKKRPYSDDDIIFYKNVNFEGVIRKVAEKYLSEHEIGFTHYNNQTPYDHKGVRKICDNGVKKHKEYDDGGCIPYQREEHDRELVTQYVTLLKHPDVKPEVVKDIKPKVIKMEYPAALGIRSIVLQEMLRHDRNNNTDGALECLRQLEEIHNI